MLEITLGNIGLPFIWHPQQNSLPSKGNIVIHLDSHPDMLTLDNVNWILPSAAAGFISTLVWLRPPWSTQIPDGSYSFTVGTDTDSGDIGVSSNLPIFVSNCLFTSSDKLTNKKDILLNIVTVGKILVEGTDDFNSFVSNIRHRFPEKNHYILDIDIDFFSTRNPYKDFLKNNDLYELLLELYWLGVNKNMSVGDLEALVQTRKQQLQDLALLWEHALTKGLEVEHPESLHWGDFKTIAEEVISENPNVDWNLIHAAGCTWDEEGNPLVEHLTSREDILTLINVTLNGLLNALPKEPSVVTIYEVDYYCPAKDVDFIHDELIKLLNSKFSTKITEHMVE